jgi:hypothetical protein
LCACTRWGEPLAVLGCARPRKRAMNRRQLIELLLVIALGVLIALVIVVES